MNTQTLLKTTLLLTILMMAAACNHSTVEPVADFASRTTSTTATASDKTGQIADCNQKSQGGVTANLMIYIDTDKKIRNDYMKVKFQQVPADFANGSYFEFFRWQSGSDGRPSLDSTPLNARFETLAGVVLTEFSPVVYWGQISQIAAASNIKDPATLFKYVRLVVDTRDIAADYDVLKIAYYNSSNQVLNDMDMLMPSFYVHPIEYAFDQGRARASYLQVLHPFVNNASSSATQLKTLSDSYCF